MSVETDKIIHLIQLREDQKSLEENLDSIDAESKWMELQDKILTEMNMENKNEHFQ